MQVVGYDNSSVDGLLLLFHRNIPLTQIINISSHNDGYWLCYHIFNTNLFLFKKYWVWIQNPRGTCQDFDWKNSKFLVNICFRLKKHVIFRVCDRNSDRSPKLKTQFVFFYIFVWCSLTGLILTSSLDFVFSLCISEFYGIRNSCICNSKSPYP